MSDRPTPETESHFPSSRHKDDSWVVSCEIGLIRDFERERDEARELSRELRDELIWKGKLVGLTRHQQALIAKAKKVLP